MFVSQKRHRISAHKEYQNKDMRLADALVSIISTTLKLHYCGPGYNTHSVYTDCFLLPAESLLIVRALWPNGAP